MKSKIIFKIPLVILVVSLLYSCSNEIDNIYKGKPKIQFEYYDLDYNKNMILRNKSTFSFGMKANDVLKDTAKIVVEFLGDVSDIDRTYKVKVATDSTTAIEGKHYEKFSNTQVFKAGALSDTLRIVVLREALGSSFTDPEDKLLALEMEASDDFDLGMKDGLRTYLYINNYLSEPAWWKDALKYDYIGFYHPKKWRILISFNDKFSNAESIPFNVNNEGRQYFQGLANYLNTVPTFDDETGYRIYIDRMVP